MTVVTAKLPGSPSSAEELRALGFVPLEIQVSEAEVETPSGMGCKWQTVGEVPDAPGLYLFTVEAEDRLHVSYVGMTQHLWMVTKGRLPRSDGARGGQRYGYPKYAGVTRQRVNVEIAQQVRGGRSVRHWVRPSHATTGAEPDAAFRRAVLRQQEEALIRRFDLRSTGWNRG